LVAPGPGVTSLPLHRIEDARHWHITHFSLFFSPHFSFPIHPCPPLSPRRAAPKPPLSVGLTAPSPLASLLEICRGRIRRLLLPPPLRWRVAPPPRSARSQAFRGGSARPPARRQRQRPTAASAMAEAGAGQIRRQLPPRAGCPSPLSCGAPRTRSSGAPRTAAAGGRAQLQRTARLQGRRPAFLLLLRRQRSGLPHACASSGL